MITSVRLRNFKNFADETLRLGPFTVIVGANASGKSNVRDAFRFLHGIGRGYALADIVGGRYGAGGQVEWERIRGAANEIARTGESEFALEAKFDTFLRTAKFEIFRRAIKEPISSTPVEVSYVVRIGCDAVDENGFSIKGVSFRTDKGYSWERPDDRPESQWQADETILANRDPLSDMPPDRNVKMLLLNREITRAFLGIRFLDPTPNLVRLPAFPGQTVLGDNGENLPTVLREICADKARKAILTGWIRELTPMDVVDFRFPSDPAGRIHLMIREEGGKEVSAYGASDGTLRFLAILAALLGPDSARLYFFEEIENGIHPSRLHLLLDLIETQTEKGEFQVVATTHSPALLTAMSDRTFEDASVVCRLPGATDAIIRPLSALPDAAELRKTQGLGRLLEGGWMETALAFTEDDRNGEGGAE